MPRKKREQIPMAPVQQSESTQSQSLTFRSAAHVEVIRGEGDDQILWSILKQTSLPLFVAGLGQICTGLFFEQAQHWWLFLSVPEIFVLVPALLGLKGNLEVTYASRFCTMSNAGQTDRMEEIKVIARFNLCLIELQSIILSVFATLVSNAVSLINCDFNLSHASVVLVSGIYAAALSSLVVGFSMVLLVVLTHRYGFDPDNIAAPLTASFSDFITLIALIGTGMLMVYICAQKLCVISILLILLLLSSAPFLASYAAKEPRTREILKNGWFSITAAIIIGCCSGVLLQSAVAIFPGIIVLHPLITGLSGNRVSVQSSRLCTALHLSKYSLGRFPAGTTVWTYLNPVHFLCLRHLNSKIAFLLLISAIPYNFFFVNIVIFAAKDVDFSWILVAAYVMTAFVQGLIMFYLCQVTVYTLWWLGLDPDNSSIPLLTSVGDVLGIGLLYVAFILLHLFVPSTVRYQRFRTMNMTRHCGTEF